MLQKENKILKTYEELKEHPEKKQNVVVRMRVLTYSGEHLT